MKKWFMIAVSVLLALLVISNIYLLVQVGRLENAIETEDSAAEGHAVDASLVGTWNVATGFSDAGKRMCLTIKRDGSFEKVTWYKNANGDECIYEYYQGRVDGNTLIYEKKYAKPVQFEGSTFDSKEYTNVKALPLQDYSFFSTITRYGNDAIREDMPSGIWFQYTRQN